MLCMLVLQLVPLCSQEGVQFSPFSSACLLHHNELLCQLGLLLLLGRSQAQKYRRQNYVDSRSGKFFCPLEVVGAITLMSLLLLL